jgi:hypothetical protein
MALASLFAVVACTSSTSSSPADGGGASGPCESMAGICESRLPMNRSCTVLTGSYVEVDGFCADTSKTCCVTRDSTGNFPAQVSGYADCGAILCKPGTTCSGSVDVTTCIPYDAGAGAEAGVEAGPDAADAAID